jgi:hypothetical protein
MSITLDELIQCEERLQTEIMERECILAAVRVLRSHAARGQSIASMDLGLLRSALLPSTGKALIVEPKVEEPVIPSPAPLPPPKPYRHPELEELTRYHATNVAIVRWGIGQVNTDFSVQHLYKLLEREGYRLSGAQISTVLTRMRKNGEIQEVVQSSGPIGTIFRRPASATLHSSAAVAEENFAAAAAA